MKKLTTLLFMLAVAGIGHAQVCVPDPSCATFGFCPDSITGLAPVHAGVPYSDVITVNVPTDTTVNFPGVGIVSLSINTLRIDSIEGLPPGLDYECAPDSCSFAGGTSGCILISGTPGWGTPEQSPLTLYCTMNVTHPLLGTFDSPQSVNTQYILSANSPIDLITGTVYRDENGNCNQDVGEYGVAGRMVVANPGNSYAYTDAAGNYSLRANTIGAVTVTHVPQLYWGGFCPQPSQSYSLNVDTTNLTIPNIDFGDTAFYDISDLRVVLTNLNVARPGFPVNYRVTLTNLGTTAESGLLYLQHDPHFTFNDATPAEQAYANNTITWDYGTIIPGATLSFTSFFTLSAQTPLNTMLQSVAWLSPLAADVNTVDNTDTLNQITQGSYDPNDKAVTPSGYITDYQVSSQIYLTYKIRFQNTGTDTAFTVVIRDTISPKLSMETFEVLASSHSVTTAYNSPREIVWTFDNILLPDSNTNEPGSHGFVKYRIRVNNNLSLGEQIPNTAYIYFDFNQPVITNTIITSVALHPGFDDLSSIDLLDVFPNPSNKLITIETPINKGFYYLSDITGKTLSNGIVSAEKFTLDISSLSSGVYFISVTDGERQVNGKVVKQ